MIDAPSPVRRGNIKHNILALANTIAFDCRQLVLTLTSRAAQAEFDTVSTAILYGITVMGRYKHKKLYNGGNTSSFGGDEGDSASSSFLKSSSTVSESSITSEGSVSQESKNHSFNRKDKKIVLKYLQEYRRGALEFYHKNGKSDINVSTTTKVDGSKDDKAEASKAMQFRPIKSSEPICISCGGSTVEFPILNEEVFSQPYLALSKGLSSNQRRYIHEICIDCKYFYIARSWCAVSFFFTFPHG